MIKFFTWLVIANLGLLVAAGGVYVVCTRLDNYFIVLPTTAIIALGVVVFIVASRKVTDAL